MSDPATRRLALVLALALAGCAPTTLAEIRAKPIDRSGMFFGDYKKVARCTLDQLDARTTSQAFGDPPFRNQLTERDDRVEIIGSVPESGVPIYEFRFHPFGPDHTAVELRHSKRHGVQNDTLWPASQKCGIVR